MLAKDVLGRRGEDLAAELLGRAGMVVLDRNWRCELGEVDLVARDGQVLVVCEVKTRSSTTYGTPLEAVDWAKVQRLHRLAYRWLEAHGLRVATVRVDVVAVLAPRLGPPTVEHLRDVA
jgi:putative endonuclease